jgi:hypothetical protein
LTQRELKFRTFLAKLNLDDQKIKAIVEFCEANGHFTEAEQKPKQLTEEE